MRRIKRTPPTSRIEFPVWGRKKRPLSAIPKKCPERLLGKDRKDHISPTQSGKFGNISKLRAAGNSQHSLNSDSYSSICLRENHPQVSGPAILRNGAVVATIDAKIIKDPDQNKSGNLMRKCRGQTGETHCGKSDRCKINAIKVWRNQSFPLQPLFQLPLNDDLVGWVLVYESR